jgi:hypothetical protein
MAPRRAAKVKERHRGEQEYRRNGDRCCGGGSTIRQQLGTNACLGAGLDRGRDDRRPGIELTRHLHSRHRAPQHAPHDLALSRLSTRFPAGWNARRRSGAWSTMCACCSMQPRSSKVAQPNRGTKPFAVASMRPANGAPTWPGNTSAACSAQCASTARRPARSFAEGNEHASALQAAESCQLSEGCAPREITSVIQAGRE